MNHWDQLWTALTNSLKRGLFVHNNGLQMYSFFVFYIIKKTIWFKKNVIHNLIYLFLNSIVCLFPPFFFWVLEIGQEIDIKKFELTSPAWAPGIHESEPLFHKLCELEVIDLQW